MSADRWIQKIAAYLAWPPDRALAPGGAEGRAAALVEAALGESVNLPHDVTQMAAGLDAPLPPDASNAGDGFAGDPKIVHPLSGAIYELNLGTNDANDVFEAVRAAVVRIREDVQGDADAPKKLFLSLWRNLLDEVKKSDVLPGGTWGLLPADPRFPSLSTWNHASAASALAGAGETPALLLFTLGSPQAFVTTSRRTQDYWMGSFLISYLMWQGMKPLADTYGPDAFLYPNLHGQPLVDKWLASAGVGEFEVEDHQEALQIANFPNVFTALVPNEEAEEIAGEVEQAIRDAWDRVGRDVKEEVEKSAQKALGYELHTEAPWSEDWCRQLEDFPDRLGVFWAACPWGEPREVLTHAFPDGEEHEPGIVRHVRALLDWIDQQDETPNAGMGYALLSNLVGGALTSRKALRDFPQVKEEGWKCSLCGERRALHPEWSTAKKRYGGRREAALLRLFWEDLASIRKKNDTRKLAGRIRPGDRLCAVCLTKRLALEASFEEEFSFEPLLFPSTATLATAPFKSNLLEALEEGGDLAKTIAHYASATRTFLDEAGIFYRSSAVPALEAIARETAHDAAENLLRLDGEWLYEEAFDRDKLRREYDVDFEDQSELDRLRLTALKALRTLLGDARALGQPCRYYAILSMDGDKMGDRISGKNAPFYEWMLHPDIAPDDLGVPDADAEEKDELKRPLGPGTHLALSGVLKDFALHLARFAVEDVHRGKLIFAGGDDAVALIPVADLLPAMRLLRTFFQGTDMEKPLSANGTTVRTRGGFGEIAKNGTANSFLLGGAPHERALRTGGAKPESFQGPTASIGVAIVHESAPLVPSIEEAVSKAMKESAKEGAGRDAFAVHLLKRSGAPVRMAAPFFPRAEHGATVKHDVLKQVGRLVDLLREKRFTSRLARDLLERPFGHEEIDPQKLRNGLPGWLRDVRRAELNRLTRRRTSTPGDTGPIETLDTLLQALHVAEEESLKDDETEQTPSAWTTLAHLILLARFLASETAHAD